MLPSVIGRQKCCNKLTVTAVSWTEETLVEAIMECR